MSLCVNNYRNMNSAANNEAILHLCDSCVGKHVAEIEMA